MSAGHETDRPDSTVGSDEAAARAGPTLWYAALIAALPLVFSSGVALLAIRHEPLLRSLEPGTLTVAYAASAATMAFGLTPTTFVALVSGYLVGWPSLFGIVPAYMAATLLGYGAASVVDRGALAATLSRKLRDDRLIDRLRQSEVPFIVLVRLSPLLPFALMNVLLAALRVRIRPYFWASLVGMLPRTILSVWVGMQFSSIVTLVTEGSRTATVQIAVITLSVASVAGLFYYGRRFFNQVMRDRQAQAGGAPIEPPP